MQIGQFMIVGLTGGIASGKSTVSKTFTKNGIPEVDADIVARQVVEVGKPGWGLLLYYFGRDYLNEDKTINRTKLGDLVFNDPIKMDLINSIMGPLIQEEVAKQLRSLQDAGHRIIVYNAALICENGNARGFKPLIVVACPKEVQLARLMKRNGLSEKDAWARISAQLPVEDKIKMADYVIDTNGTIEESVQQTEKIIYNLNQQLDDSDELY